MKNMLDIGPLTPADLEDAMRLSTQAGWNQVSADWKRLIALDPAACLAGRSDGRVMATATLVRSEPAWAWVGMVLVDESLRGRGYGGAIMDAILTRARELGSHALGLDATDAGRPVYLKRGFYDLVGIDRRTLAAVDRQAFIGSDEPMHNDDWASLLALDREVIGVDRSKLMGALRDDATCRVIRQGGSVKAFGFHRVGRTADQIGPVIAQLPADAKVLIHSLSAPRPMEPARDLIIDTLRGGELDGWLDSIGFSVTRKLTRMTSGDPGTARMNDRRVIAAAGFELG